MLLILIHLESYFPGVPRQMLRFSIFAHAIFFSMILRRYDAAKPPISLAPIIDVMLDI